MKILNSCMILILSVTQLPKALSSTLRRRLDQADPNHVEEIKNQVLTLLENGDSLQHVNHTLSKQGYNVDTLKELFANDDQANDEINQAMQKTIYQTSMLPKNARNMANEECNLIDIFEIGTTAGKIKAAYEFFSSPELDALIRALHDADFHTARVEGCKAVSELQISKAVSCLAQELDMTLTFDAGFDSTVAFVTTEFGFSFIFGEDGQFACAENFGIGATLGLLGGGASTGISISPASIGGWDSVGADLREPDICFSVGYSAVVGLAATISISPSRIGQSEAVDMLTNALTMKGESMNKIAFLEALLSLTNVGGITSFGLEATIGFDLLDALVVGLILPDVSVTACTEELTHCTGPGCREKLMVEPWADGYACGLGTTCSNCHNEATYWYGTPAFTKCGSEPKWDDGVPCLAGTSCNACKNGSSYWYSKAFTACGQEPKWGDGYICAHGTTCYACKNPASYWYGKAFTACGQEPKWNDGTTCLLGTSCNACKNTATWWVGAAISKCGREPCWERGTICGLGTTEYNCCRGADCPWYQFGVCTCK